MSEQIAQKSTAAPKTTAKKGAASKNGQSDMQNTVSEGVSALNDMYKEIVDIGHEFSDAFDDITKGFDFLGPNNRRRYRRR